LGSKVFRVTSAFRASKVLGYRVIKVFREMLDLKGPMAPLGCKASKAVKVIRVTSVSKVVKAYKDPKDSREISDSKATSVLKA
jgi:hypothetical protein